MNNNSYLNALLKNVEKACPCLQCHYDYDVISLHQRPGGVICPFRNQSEKRCNNRAAWESWREWTYNVLEATYGTKQKGEK